MSILLLISITFSLLYPPDPLERRVLAAAEAHFASTYPEMADRLDVRVTRLSVDAAEGVLRVALPTPGLPRAHAKVDVLSQTPSGWTRAGWAMLYVAHYDSVAVAARAVRRDERVQPTDVVAAWIETTRFHGEPLTMEQYRAAQDQAALVATKPLRPGTPLRTTDVRAPWAVQTGEAVRMRYGRSGIVLELKTRARETGALDDEIRVYSQDTGTTYRARVTGPGQAEWIETL